MAFIPISQHTSTVLQKLDPRSALAKSFALNPLLTLVGLAMIVTLIGTLIGIVVDHRVITGVPAWLKPTKFATSVGFYSFTLLWMLSFVKGHKRLVSFIANVIALGFLIEMVIIVGQVIRGTTSHFNFTTSVDGTLYTIMGVFVTIIWSMTLIAAVLLLMQRMSTPIFAWSLRLGILLSIIGMAVAFLMTQPTAIQLAALHAGGHLTYIGAHSVGIADGGPGLPFLGWSTVGGDLRIAHFVGLHALQVIPFVGWLLILLRSSILRNGHKLALLWTFSMSYLGLIALLTWQGLRGQSIIAPDALTLQVFATLVGCTALTVIAIMIHARIHPVI
ncbi:MAG: hypothetical protein NVS4B11_02180 [Ktedonobacteraceae bacterium]